ncbi:helix-turn-helix domain-containing protein [Thermodesulfobacteriota bacterium]
MHRTEEQTLHPYNLEQATRRFQQDHIHNVLELTNWDLEAAARFLGIELYELKQKINAYLSSGDISGWETGIITNNT